MSTQQKPETGEVDRRRFVFLVMALLIYGFAGSPTPDHPGITELVVGMLLVLAAGPLTAFGVVFGGIKTEEKWKRYGKLLLVYGLSVPVIVGLAEGNAAGSMLRDIIPFLFLMLPLFMSIWQGKEDKYFKWLIVSVLFIGIMFSLRCLHPESSEANVFGFSAATTSEQLYLANSPTVLFTAMFLIGAIFAGLSGRMGKAGFVTACGSAILLLIPIIAMASAMQRASMGMIFIMIVWMSGLLIVKSPVKALTPIITLALAALFFKENISELYESLVNKTLTVGVNNRTREAMAVIETLQDSFKHVMFGKGWGAFFSSPAVGDVSVNFTHNLFTSFMLKTGLVGTMLAGIYFFQLGREIAPVFKTYPAAGFALLAPFFINLLLYASYKSLDFGVILLLIIVFRENAAKLQEALRCSNESSCNILKTPEIR